jgi:glycopeptide antibiotics resistance protein
MFLKYTKWAMLWALVILILCGIPGRDIPHISFLEMLSFDKFVHAGIFFVLILLTVRGFLLQTKFDKLRRSPKGIAFVICILYGGSLEIMQGTLFEERSADIFDFIANSFGCLMGLLFYDWIEKKILTKIIV